MLVPVLSNSPTRDPKLTAPSADNINSGI